MNALSFKFKPTPHKDQPPILLKVDA